MAYLSHHFDPSVSVLYTIAENETLRQHLYGYRVEIRVCTGGSAAACRPST
jgi:hypothetical protein